ncbi:hypothetical protein EYF80_016930 [Liparis tanakae]|uniref:Uncharacterized protein n=1 Tax=Liparis tanakae TaxID=230148 RepID=A0A4Z2I425_9TELE|nr:hypothetical protein EYF80_016930 [Liparis tanakae]
MCHLLNSQISPPPSKSFVSFIKLIGVDSRRRIYPEFSICDCAAQAGRRRSESVVVSAATRCPLQDGELSLSDPDWGDGNKKRQES